MAKKTVAATQKAAPKAEAPAKEKPVEVAAPVVVETPAPVESSRRRG